MICDRVECLTTNRPGATRCRDCGHPLPGGKPLAGTLANHRHDEILVREGRFWEPVGPDADWITRLTQLERAFELADEDADRAQQRFFNARARSPELADHRELSPGDRHAWVERMQAEAAWAAATERRGRAKTMLDRALDAHEEAVAGVPKWWRPDDPYNTRAF